MTAGLVGILLLGAPVSAQQKMEASIGAGYTASEGVSVDQRPLLGQVYDSLTPISGASFHFTFGYFFNENAELEFMWARQKSQLDAEGPNSASLPLSELSINNYMGNFVYNWGEHDAKTRPFLYFGLGTTQYTFGSDLLAGAVGNIPNDTRFATNIGGGAKFFFSPHVGAKVGIRWTPTYIGSTSAGVWCDPFYGCWPLANAHYANQFDTAGSIVFRF